MPGKKPYKTIKETPKGRNVKSINTKTGKTSSNKSLIKKQEKGELSDYSTVKPKNIKKFLRSKPDNKKKNNLDPKIRI